MIRLNLSNERNHILVGKTAVKLFMYYLDINPE
jgi:hypothetical protein